MSIFDDHSWSPIVAEYAKLPLIPPFLQPGAQRYYNGVNFASAGAGALVETFQGDVSEYHVYSLEKYHYNFCNFICLYINKIYKV